MVSGNRKGDRLARLAEAYLCGVEGIPTNMPAFTCRYFYPPPLEFVVRGSVWAVLRRRFACLGRGSMQDPANGLRRIPLPRTPVNNKRPRSYAGFPRTV